MDTGRPEADARSRDDPSLTRWRESYEGLLEPGGTDCPPPDVLAALVLGDVPPDDRAGFADHVVACRRCRDTFDDLSSLHELAGPALPRLERDAARRGWPVVALAIWVVIAATAGVALWRVLGGSGGSPGDPEEILEPGDGAELTAPPSRFRWQRQPGAERYRVVLEGPAEQAAWHSEWVETTLAELPAAQGRRLARGVPYRWHVEWDRRGVRHRSPPRSFRIRAED